MKKPKRIKNLNDLVLASSERRAVYFLHQGMMIDRPMPAAVLLNMSGVVIHSRIVSGLFIYTRSKSKGHWGTRQKKFAAKRKLA